MRYALVCFLACMTALAGCSPAQNTAVALHPPIAPVTGLIVLDGISLINTKKTVEDHVASWITGQDCSVVRASQGGDYCVNIPPPPSVVRTSYCYKSIALVSCYERKQDVDESRYYGSRVDMVQAQTP